jgi:predicted O-methyltransferase YrrM
VRETLAALAGPFDFVLLDLWKDLCIPCFELFYPKLGPRGFVIADSMIAPTARRVRLPVHTARACIKTPDLESMLLPIGSGIELSRKPEAT